MGGASQGRGLMELDNLGCVLLGGASQGRGLVGVTAWVYSDWVDLARGVA